MGHRSSREGQNYTTFTQWFFETSRNKPASSSWTARGNCLNRSRPKGLQENLIIIEPSLDYPLALNPFDLGSRDHHTIGLLEYIFSALLDAKMTPLQSTLFRSCLRATLYHPNPSIQTFKEILNNGATFDLPADLKTSSITSSRPKTLGAGTPMAKPVPRYSGGSVCSWRTPT